MQPLSEKRSAPTIIWSVLAVLIIWIALLIASSIESGKTIASWLNDISVLLQNPFSITLNQYSLKFVVIFLLFYGVAVAVHLTEKMNKRPGEEHGSARWGSARQLNAKYCDRKNPNNNVILTENIKMGLDSRRHRRNLNYLVVGGSGSGKTRFWCKNQLLSMAGSYFIVDPKSEMLRDIGPAFIAKGIPITVLNLITPETSCGYNPLHYVRNDLDALKLINTYIQSTTPAHVQSSADPFWEKSEQSLLSAFMLYLKSEAPEYEQNFPFMTKMLDYFTLGAAEDDELTETPVDLLFQGLEETDPNHIAVQQYHTFRLGASKTLRSILISTAVRMAPFALPAIANITTHDDLQLDRLGLEQRAIFACIPDNDSTLNFLISMLYQQLFSELYRVADTMCGGSLPHHVFVICDEWANTYMTRDFPKVLATCRSRNCGIHILVQNLSNIKQVFEKEYESIIGNCDTMVFMGSNEYNCLKAVSDLTGRGTIEAISRGTTKGRNGSYSKNYQAVGRELITPDELRTLDNQDAIVFIRGERPVIDHKHDVMKHVNVGLSADGGTPPLDYSPVPSYELPDLPYAFDSLDDLEIEMVS